MNYTPLQQGQAPTFGTSGESVANFQSQLNTQNQGASGWTPLVVDGIYGTKTQAGASFGKTNQTVMTSNMANKEFSNYSSDLTKALTGLQSMGNTQNNTTGGGVEITVDNVAKYDKYAGLLDEMSKTASLATKSLIASIQASKMNQQNNISQQFDKYKRGLQLLGIQTNQAQSTPDLLMGSVQEAENQKMQKLSELDREEKKAILDAETAQQEQNLSVLKETMERVKEIKKEKQEQLKAIFDTLEMETGIADNVSQTIYSTINKLSATDKEQYLNAVSQKYNIPMLSLVSSLERYHTLLEKEKSKGKGKDEGGFDDEGFGEEGFGDNASLGEGTQTLKMNTRRTRKLSEVGINSDRIIYIQEKLKEGVSIEDIISGNSFSDEAVKLLLKYIK